MRPVIPLAFALCLAALAPARAQMTVVCTVVADARSDAILRREGDCATRVSPASTFKIPISLMGFDAGVLTDEHTPVMPFREGYPAWIASWKADTDPTSWIRNSVVWYSQQITRSLGEKRFAAYVAAFDYGNRDVSGDPGQGDGLTRSWLGSSLKISPLEQIGFLRRLLGRQLPVSPKAIEMTTRLLDTGLAPGGWRLRGKTGLAVQASPGKADDLSPRIGWFVGWAEKDGRSVLFARLVRFEGKAAVAAGPSAKDTLIADLFETPGSL